jgi:hypothetical protein
MMAVVCGVIAVSIFLGAILKVPGSISTNMGMMPFHSGECAVATKEYGDVITSPVIRRDCKAVISARVPLVNSEMYFTPR